MLFSAWLIAEESKAERSAMEERLLNTANALAADVDREVISAINTLQTLALSYDLDRQSADEFRYLSDRMLSSQENWQMVVVEDPTGKQLASMTKASDATVPDSALTSEERIKSFQTKEGHVIDSPLASVVGRSVGILVPVRVLRRHHEALRSR